VAKIFSRNKDKVKVPPEFIDEFDEDGLAGICDAYFGLGGRHKKELAPPSCPDDEPEGHYTAWTGNDKDHRRAMPESVVFQVQNLNIFIYWFLLRDASDLRNCQQTEQGRDYLERCWAAEQTEPDRKMLWQYFGKH
jgi:hypothetical protein